MVDKPRKPDTPEISGTEYEFNLGLYRIETLSTILEVCAKKYKTAITERTEEAVHDYQSMVNLLYTETYIYMQNDTNIEVKGVKQDKEKLLKAVLDDFSSLSGDEEIMQRLQRVRQVYLEIRSLLQKVGIDIPEKEKIGEMDAFMEG